MATVTFKVDTPNVNDLSSYVSGSFSAAVGDLLLVFVAASATVAAGTMADSLGEVTFTKVISALRSTSVDTLYLFISNGFCMSTSARTVTFDCTGDAATGAIITVYSITGMSKAGSPAVRQTAIQQNQSASAAPAPAFGIVALTGNPVLGAVANSANPAGMTPPTGTTPTWTEGSDSGYATPTRGQETIWANSGFTGTTITWGSNTATFGDIIVELDASSFPAGEDDSLPHPKYPDPELSVTVWQ